LFEELARDRGRKGGDINCGYKKLGELVEATKLFDIEARSVGEEGQKAINIKDRGEGTGRRPSS